jgi:hypothetical protein
VERATVATKLVLLKSHCAVEVAEVNETLPTAVVIIVLGEARSAVNNRGGGHQREKEWKYQGKLHSGIGATC